MDESTRSGHGDSDVQRGGPRADWPGYKKLSWYGGNVVTSSATGTLLTAEVMTSPLSPWKCPMHFEFGSSCHYYRDAPRLASILTLNEAITALHLLGLYPSIT